MRPGSAPGVLETGKKERDGRILADRHEQRIPFPSAGRIPDRSSPSRVRCAALRAPWTAPGRSEARHTGRRERGSQERAPWRLSKRRRPEAGEAGMVVSGEGSGITTVQGQTEFAATASPRPAPRGRDRESSAARSNFIEHHVPSDVKRVRMEARSNIPSAENSSLRP